MKKSRVKFLSVPNSLGGSIDLNSSLYSSRSSDASSVTDGAIKTPLTNSLWSEKESRYLYSPIGVGFITGLGKGWSIGGTGEFDYLWWGRQVGHPLDFVGIEDIESRLMNTYGLRGSVVIEKKYKKVAFEGGPFVRYWDVGKLEPVDENVGQPIQPSWISKNHSTEVGFKLAVKF